MDYIKMILRRGRRRNRIPHGLLVSVSAFFMAFVLMLTLGSALLSLPVSARTDFRMPRTENGVVTDDDGVIDSEGIAESLPNGSEMIPGGDGSAAGESILPDLPNGGTESVTEGTQTTTTPASDATTAKNEMSEAVDDVVGDDNMSAWVIGLIILAVVVVVIILIIWWASGSRKRR